MSTENGNGIEKNKSVEQENEQVVPESTTEDSTTTKTEEELLSESPKNPESTPEEEEEVVPVAEQNQTEPSPDVEESTIENSQEESPSEGPLKETEEVVPEKVEEAEKETEVADESAVGETSIADEVLASLKTAQAIKEETTEVTVTDSVEEESPVEVSDEEHAEGDVDEEEHEEEVVDYSSLSKDGLIEAARRIVEEFDVLKVYRSLTFIRDEIDRVNEEEKEEAKAAFLKEEGASEIDFHYEPSKEVQDFYSLYKEVRARRKAYYDQLTKERQDNLKAKEGIIEEIKALIDNAEEKGSLDKVKELQQKWKEIGSVPKEDAENLYKTYSALLDMFYDNKNIEYNLKELDRKKNMEAKLELCERAEALNDLDNINEAVRKLNQLHEEFKAIGPVPREEQETVWQRFKTASDKLYDIKREQAEEFKKQLEENMRLKQELCLKVEPFIQFDSDRIKEWNAKTKELLEVQKEWEAVGQLPREVAKDINRQFWGNFKSFFANKGKFFEKLDAQRKENLEKKEVLVAKAEELKESKDWGPTTDAYKQLQKDWKEIGPVPEANRDEVYKRFKAACDYFFDRKRNRRAEQDKEFEDNLKQKLDLCKEIEELADTGKGTLEEITALKDKYFSIGFVPRKDINSILEKTLSSIDKFFDKSEIEDKEKKRLEIKAELLKSVPNAPKKMARQEQAIRTKINHIENDIALWQNNIQFFANSKTADKLKQDFNKKIEKAQKEIQDLKSQLSVIRSINA